MRRIYLKVALVAGDPNLLMLTAILLAATAAVEAANITVGPFALQLDPKSQVVAFLALSNDEEGFAFNEGSKGNIAIGDV